MNDLAARVTDLAQQLAEAEATIEALLSGEIDAVVDARSQSPLLLFKAQEALQQSEERYRRIVDTTREGVWIIDAAHKTTFMNRRMAEMLRCEAHSAPLSSPFDFLDAGEAAKLAAYLQRTDGRQIDIRYTRTDGTSVWTLLEAAPLFDRGGHYEGSMAMIVDITDRKEAEIAVRHERDRAESYLDTAEVIMLAVDLDGRITMINRYGREVLGWAPDELIGRDWFTTCVPARLRDSLRARFHAFLRGGRDAAKDVIVENAILTKSGEERLIEWRNSLLRDDAGVAIGVITSGTDMTERTEVLAKLTLAEERMRFALENAEVGIWDMDYKTGLLAWSPTLERQYGMAPGTFDGTFTSFAALIHPDDRETVLTEVRTATRTGSDFSLQHRVTWRDGTVRWLESMGHSQLDENGEPLRAVGISLDVTERRLMERQYQTAMKMEAIGQLASGVAHDFNNLLTVILGFTEFVIDDPAIGDRHRRDLGETIKAARRAALLTTQLLAFSRQQVLETVPLDLNKLITDMTGMLRRLIGEHIHVALALAPRLPLMLSDRGQVEQVVMNLLVNARDAMPAGGTVTLTTSYAEFGDATRDDEPILAGRYVVLEVVDDGTGMNAETLRRLFEPFYTTKGVGQGTGLGLSTVYGIVKQSKGYIFVDSKVAIGTTFRVYLPCADQAACVAHAEATPTRPEAPVSETILLVEDETAVREFSRRSLERAGYRVLVAENGDEADQLFAERAGEIDLVLTDVVMPGCGGPELLTRLRRRKTGLKVLYMSGYTEQSAASAIAFRDGPAVLSKPFTAEDMRRRVREVLDRAPQP